ncbi:MAG TPA: glycosyltransferase family 4 protein [Anaerolineae bacterium]
MKHINNQTGKPYRILWFGDMVILSGFGRIGNEVLRRLKGRGYEVQAAGIGYSGWPHDLPFHVWPLANTDLWNPITSIVAQTQPDILISCQDFPYHTMLYNGCRIDFSRLKWLWITPIDGTPVHPDWLRAADYADAGMVISRFGVEAMRQAGKHVDLCHPGANAGEFYPAAQDERARLREVAGFAPDDFIVGVVCMNQGRKAIPPMLEAFHEFARDKPNTQLILDMDKASPAGWDLPNLLVQLGWTDEQKKRIRYREDLFKAPDMLPLRNRYVLMDAHMVISHREGFGLPLLESMACRIPTITLDYCSGTEIIGENRGWLIPRLDYMQHGTWGGARDAFPDVPALIAALEDIYRNPIEAAARAERGYQWAQAQTWDVTTDQIEAVIQRIVKEIKSHAEPRHANTSGIPAPGLSDIHSRGHRDGQHPESAHAVDRDSELQRPGTLDPLLEVAGADGAPGGAGGTLTDHHPG